VVTSGLRTSIVMHGVPPSAAGGGRRFRTEASLEECAELVADVTRNAPNDLDKIAVALGADARPVEEGFEIYDVDADGEILDGPTVG
jgi:hypothetical protein